MRRIPVYLHAADMISRAGLVSQLRPRPEVLLLDEDELARAAVAVVVSDGVGEETLQVLRSLRSHGVRQLVLVATHIDDVGLVAAVEIGVAGLLRRADASAERLVSVIGAAAAGDGSVPPDLLGRLLHQVGALQRSVLGPRGLTFSGLAEREIEVLRLVADGLDTAEIAEQLSYSQRTIKNVLHDVTSRLHLRNRSHAVAYALRNGLI
jgi:DNA-binding NarL/FixJ family response regulator